MEARRNEWLLGGNLIITSTERGARAIRFSFDEQQRQNGCLGWVSPTVYAWEAWLRALWLESAMTGERGALDAAGDGPFPFDRTVLTPAQELVVWRSIIGETANTPGSSLRVASLAMRAFGQLCVYAPEYLAARKRVGWSGDARIFSGWLDAFLDHCKRERLLSSNQIPIVWTGWREGCSGTFSTEAEEAQQVLLVGFDRIPPVQQRLLDLACHWRQEELPAATETARHLEYPDPESEIAACFQWLHDSVAHNPDGRWILLTPSADSIRGKLERELHNLQQRVPSPVVAEFALGPSLASVTTIRAALLLLQWMVEALDETQLLWLLSTGCFVASETEQENLLRCFESLQGSEFARTEWSLDAFCQRALAQDRQLGDWCVRILGAAQQLAAEDRTATPDVWTEDIVEALHAALWVSRTTLDSTAYQALEQFHAVLDECAATGAVTETPIAFPQLRQLVQYQLNQKPFTTATSAPQILIASPAESAGLVADGIWFLGADGSQWPVAGKPNPLIPIAVQIEATMPHASLDLDIEHVTAITQRLATMAPELCISFARRQKDGECSPSAAVVAMLGDPVAQNAVASPGLASGGSLAHTSILGDDAAPRLATDGPHHAAIPVSGGASVLSDQSQCAFRAFATHRLGVTSTQSAEPGISASLRGRLLHLTLASLWGGPENGGLHSLEDLLHCLHDARPFPLPRLVETHAARAFAQMREALHSETISPALVAIERERMERLVCEWLRYEAARQPFNVMGCEIKEEVEIAGIRLRVRLDRMDEVDGRLLILDYKTSAHSPRGWLDERPDDLQLPLYSLNHDEAHLEGLLFANLVASEKSLGFRGLTREAKQRLLPNLSAQGSLVSHPLTSDQLREWRRIIEHLAQEFVLGKADVNPKQYPKTCEYCGLQSLCRVAEVCGAGGELDSSDEVSDDE